MPRPRPEPLKCHGCGTEQDLYLISCAGCDDPKCHPERHLVYCPPCAIVSFTAFLVEARERAELGQAIKHERSN
jgi:hypothetical protein